MKIERKEQALKQFFAAMQVLRDENILINKKDFTCQIGEWLIEMILNGKRSANGIQKGWDIEANGEFIQVKAHSKSEGNNNRWSRIDKDFDVQIDRLIIVVFTDNYKLKEFFDVPWEIARSKIKLRGKKNPKNELNWNDISTYKVNIENIPNQKIVALFRE